MLRMRNKVLHQELSYILNGLCFEVHNKLGRFRNEKQYSDALEKMLQERKITYVRECELAQSFEGEKKRRNIIDFLVDDQIIIEVKAKPAVTKEDYFQAKRYLASSDKNLAIVVNFRQKHLVPKRVLSGATTL